MPVNNPPVVTIASIGDPAGDETRVNTVTAGNQILPSVAALSDGGYVVSWVSLGQDGSGYGVYAQRYDASGVTQGGETRVNTVTSDHQYEPSVAGLSGGGYVVTWSSSNQDGSSSGVYAQRYDASGVAQGGETRVNTVTAGDQLNPSVAALSGGYVVTWASFGQDGSDFGIYAQRYDASGVAQGSETRVNTVTANDQSQPSVAALSGGGYVVTWTSEDQDGSGLGAYAQRYDASGVAQGSETRVNTVTANDQSQPWVAALSGGGYVVSWTSLNQDGSLNGIYAQRYDASGVAQGGETRVNTVTADQQLQPSVAALSDGGYVVTWRSNNQDGSGYGVYAQRYHGELFAAEQTALDLKGKMSVADADAGSGTLTATLSAGYGTLTVTAGTSGASVSGSGTGTVTVEGTLAQINALFSTDPTSSVAYRADTDAPPTTALLTLAVSDNGHSGGGPEIANDSETIHIAAVNDAPVVTIAGLGDPTGGETRVNTVTANDQEEPSVAALSDGGYVVSWQSSDQDGSSYGVYTQRYDASGVAQGDETRVNTVTASNQFLSSVAALSGGGYVVTWVSLGQDGDSHGIYAQRYDASGVAQGGETRVNTVTASSQFLPSVAALFDGGYVITWASFNQDGSGWGIYAQRYDGVGVAQGDETQINTFTASHQQESSVAALSGGGYVVTWTSLDQDGSSSGIYSQRYDASGVAQGDETRVNTVTANIQREPSVAGLSDGGYVVTWASLNQDGSGFDVYAQRYDASGMAQGGETRVNTVTANSQFLPSVAALPGGGYVVTWSSLNQDGDIYGVYAQRFDGSGVAQGDETRVNTVTAGNQSDPSVAALSSGGYVVTWSSFGQDSGSSWGVYAQRYHGGLVAVEQTALDLKGKMSVVDADAGSGILTATLSVSYGTLAVTAGASGASVSGSGTASVIVEGTLTQINALLSTDATSTVAYTANTDTPSATTLLTLSVNDNGNSGGASEIGSDSETIPIAAVNDAPALDLDSGASGEAAVLGYTENAGPTAISPLATLTDPDSPNFGGGNLTVSFTGGGSPDDRLTILHIGAGAGEIGVSAGNVSYGGTPIGTVSGGTDGSTPLVVTLNGSASPEAVQALIRTVAYRNVSDNPSTAVRDLWFSVSDGDGGTTGLAATVNVTAVNDAPAVAISGGGTPFTEGDPAKPIDPALTLADPDDANLFSATVAITANFVAGQDLLAFTNSDAATFGNIAASYNGMTGVLSLSSAGGTATLVQWQAALRAVTFGNTSDEPGPSIRTVSFTVHDGEDVSNVASKSVVVTPLDAEPSGPIIGTPGPDIFNLDGKGDVEVYGLGEDDGFIFGGTFNADDHVDGGAGDNDQVSIHGIYPNLTFGPLSLVNIETLVVIPGFDYNLTTVDANVVAGRRLQIFGTTLGAGDNLTFNGSAETDGYFVIYGGGGVDNLTGGDGNDGFYFGPGNFTGADIVHGGPGGNDQLGLDGHYSLTLGGNFNGIETLVLYRGPSADLNRFNLITNDAAVAAGQRLTVLGTTLGTNLVFNGSAETDGSFRIFGGEGNDTLTGGAGADLLFGGLGGDTMSGGAGNDTFLYHNVNQSTAGARDSLLGFQGGDIVDLSGIDGNALTEANDPFSFIGASAFSGVAGQLRAYESGGIWTIEGDVNGDSIADLAIAVSTNSYPLGASDFAF